MISKNKRKSYTAEFKVETLNLTQIKGVVAVSKDLGLYESQLYNWCAASEKKMNVSQREAELSAEVARLERQLAEQP